MFSKDLCRFDRVEVRTVWCDCKLCKARHLLQLGQLLHQLVEASGALLHLGLEQGAYLTGELVGFELAMKVPECAP